MRGPRGREMKPWMKMVLRFLAIFAVVVVVMTVAWPMIAPTYTRWITGAARAGFHWVEAPNVSVLEVRTDELWVYRIVGPAQITPFTYFDRYTFFAIVPLIALFLATPGLGWMKRLARLCISLGILFLVHAGYIVVSVRLAYAAIGLTSVGPFVARTLDGWQTVVRVLWDAAPLALWAAFTARVWSRHLRTYRGNAEAEGKAHRTGTVGWGTEASKGWES